jgi:hypothetical protein
MAANALHAPTPPMSRAMNAICAPKLSQPNRVGEDNGFTLQNVAVSHDGSLGASTNLKIVTDNRGD